MIILASGSPRRRELMTTVELAFKVCPAEGDENLDPALCPADAAMALATQKAQEVAKKYPHDCVVGACAHLAPGAIVKAGNTVPAQMKIESGTVLERGAAFLPLGGQHV